MNIKIIVITALFGGILAANPAYARPNPQSAILVVLDDSGVLTEPEKAKRFKIQVFSRLKGLKSLFREKDTRIEVISTSLGRSVWIGKPKDLKNTVRTKDLISKLEANADHCNDLTSAFKTVETRLKSLKDQGFQDISIYVLSSLIDTPKPCSDTLAIDLPQMPIPLDVNKVLTASAAVKNIAFYWVNPHQEAAWSEFLEPTRQWASKNGVQFALLDMENSTYEIANNNLVGIGR